MKLIAVAFTLLLAGASAMPEKQVVDTSVKADQVRIITDAINVAVQEVSQMIVDAGLDPYVLDELSYEIVSPEGLVKFTIFLRDFSFSGASNIVINSLNFSTLTTRLTFDISLPKISFDFGDSGASLSVLGHIIDAFHFSGGVDIIQPRVTGNIRFNIGIISGVSIRDATVGFSLGDIDSDLLVKLWLIDLSSPVNKVIGETIPDTIDRYGDQINEYLTDLVLAAIESAL